MTDPARTTKVERNAYRASGVAQFHGTPGAVVDWRKRICDDADAADALRAQVAALQAENERMSWWIDSRGYRRCDIPACNCPYWHGGNVEARLDEFKAELSEHVDLNGKTLLDGLKQITSELAAAQAKLAVPVPEDVQSVVDDPSLDLIAPGVRSMLEALARDNAALRTQAEVLERERDEMQGALLAAQAWMKKHTPNEHSAARENYERDMSHIARILAEKL